MQLLFALQHLGSKAAAAEAPLLQCNLAHCHPVAVHRSVNDDLDVSVFGHISYQFLGSFVAILVKFDELVVVCKYSVAALLAQRHTKASAAMTSDRTRLPYPARRAGYIHQVAFDGRLAVEGTDG